ncbi:conserved exported hypothetical protein [Verrucomicrobia bacterium]|nr:conserved exported hypothetical protein [Verrucomicrobiota bacterium]
MRNNNRSPDGSLRAGTFATSLLVGLLFLIPLSGLAAKLKVPPVAGGEGIQQALDQIGVGGQVILSRGTYLVDRPIILRLDGQMLRGAGPETILCLADNANCPVVILSPPMDDPKRPTQGLQLRDLLVDGNRTKQQRELWRFLPSGARINSNGIHVCDTDDAIIEHVICRRCRSGGLVSTGHTRRLTVRDYTAFDNQFDGLACYRTEDSHFSRLNLHDNLAAGISLDLEFDHNVINGAVLTGNDLGVFMRSARDNVFERVTIRRSRHDGVFMAQVGEPTQAGWQLYPGTQCTGNRFYNLQVTDCGGRAFQVNNDSCTNNVINGGQFLDNAQGGLSQPGSNPVTSHALKVHPLPLDIR